MALKYFLAGAEIILLILFLLSVPFINYGNVVGVLFTAAALFATLRFDIVKKFWGMAAGKAVIICFCACAAAGLIFGAVCSVKMISAMNREPDSPSAVIVLGCQVKGRRPSKMLARRLDAAVTYLNEHPEFPCIVSGGKGDDEEISEALCMKNYLTEKGISESRIIMEDRSTTTVENLIFSGELLDSMGLPRSIVLVTDGYHQYRAQLIAEKQGFDKVGAVSADTELRFITTYWVREWIAILHEALLK